MMVLVMMQYLVGMHRGCQQVAACKGMVSQADASL